MMTLGGIVAFAPFNGVGWDQTWPVITLGFGVSLSFLAEWFRDKRTTKRDDKRDAARQVLEDEREGIRRELEDAREQERHDRDLRREHAVHQRAALMELQEVGPLIMDSRIKQLQGAGSGTSGTIVPHPSETITLLRFLALNASLTSEPIRDLGAKYYTAVVDLQDPLKFGDTVTLPAAHFIMAIGAELAKVPEI